MSSVFCKTDRKPPMRTASEALLYRCILIRQFYKIGFRIVRRGGAHS